MSATSVTRCAIWCYTRIPVTYFWSAHLSVCGINTSSASAVSPLS